MAVSEDDIIKRKLLIEGDGGNDEKRINTLLRTFIKWTNSSESAEESDTTLLKMNSILAQCQLTMQKSTQVCNMNLKEQEQYDKVDTEIDKLMSITEKQIEECKGDLKTAKCIRKNKQEYDLLAKVIQTNPDRYETLELLKSIDEELLKLVETKMKFKDMLSMRKKHFYVLLSSIQELQGMLEENGQLNDDGESPNFEAMDTD